MKRKLVKLCALIVTISMLPVFSAFAADWTNASDWAKEELGKASQAKLIPECLNGKDLTKQITRAEFAALAVSLYEAITGSATEEATDNPFTDTNDAEVLKAYALGIVNGMSENTFSPDLMLDREQAATMLTRTMSVAAPGLQISTDGAPTFADSANISDWARDSVLYMARRKIIGGFPDNTFRPCNKTENMKKTFYANATREQAILIALRSLNASKVPDNSGIEIS